MDKAPPYLAFFSLFPSSSSTAATDNIFCSKLSSRTWLGADPALKQAPILVLLLLFLLSFLLLLLSPQAQQPYVLGTAPAIDKPFSSHFLS